MINMMGGNPMMSFMMMMMNPQFMQQMMQMQKQGATFGEASKVVAEKTEISDFEKLLEEVIENQRASLPSISKKDAIRFIKLCKNIYGAFNDIGTNLSGVTFDPNKKKSILLKMQNTINIVKEDQEITDDALSELFLFVIDQFTYGIKLKDFVEQKADEACNIFDKEDKKTNFKLAIKYDLSYYIIDKFIKNLFNKESSIKSLYKHFHERNIKLLENSGVYRFTDDQKEILTNCLNEIQKHIDDKVDFDVSKITAENKLIRNKSIIRRRPIRKNKIINESEFLKSELKRLWKL